VETPINSQGTLKNMSTFPSSPIPTGRGESLKMIKVWVRIPGRVPMKEFSAEVMRAIIKDATAYSNFSQSVKAKYWAQNNKKLVVLESDLEEILSLAWNYFKNKEM
jgi:hypothetical protein